VEQVSAVAQPGTVLHLVVAAEQCIVPVGIAAAHHPQRSLAAFLVAVVTDLATPRRHPQTPDSQVADMTCRARHDRERHLDCLVRLGMGIVEEQVPATAGRHWTRWERTFEMLWERRNPTARGQLDVPHR
jgi:hypothetical protein